MWSFFNIHQWMWVTDGWEKQKSYFYFVSWNTLSHLNMIGLTHTRHTQKVIVEVNTPFTSLCGYLTDVNSGGVVRQPPFPIPCLSSNPLLACSVQGPRPVPYLFSLNPTCALTHCPPPLPPFHLGTEDHCTMFMWGGMDLTINIWAYMGVERENSQNC